jgi:hypothetical protein
MTNALATVALCWSGVLDASEAVLLLYQCTNPLTH